MSQALRAHELELWRIIAILRSCHTALLLSCHAPPTPSGPMIDACARRLLVPYGDACLPTMLQRCERSAQRQVFDMSGKVGHRRCAGLILNRMQVKTCAGVHAGNRSLLASSHFALGGLQDLTKSIVRVELGQGLSWTTPHAPVLNASLLRTWCLMGEESNCTRVPSQPFVRLPCSGYHAIVYHLEVSSLHQWAVKRSFAGRIDQAAINPCPTCFAPLHTIASEFSDACKGGPVCGRNAPGPPRCHSGKCIRKGSYDFEKGFARPPTNEDGFQRRSLSHFMREVDDEIVRRPVITVHSASATEIAV